MDATPWPDRFLGGAICLDFINTIERFGSRHEEDRFTDYDAVLRWSSHRGTMASDALAKLERLAALEPTQASETWLTAIELRRSMRALMVALMNDRPLQPMLARLNDHLAELPPVATIAHKAGAFYHRLPGERLEEPLWPVLWSAVALLTEKHGARLGQCQAESCRYLFLDLSRNKSRRWCSSDICGNRERVRRAYRAEKLDIEL